MNTARPAQNSGQGIKNPRKRKPAGIFVIKRHCLGYHAYSTYHFFSISGSQMLISVSRSKNLARVMSGTKLMVSPS